MAEFTKYELAVFRRLKKPADVQDYLDSLAINYESDGVATIKSPLRVVRAGNAHCIEAAILGAYILSLQGHRPLLLHLEVTKQKKDGVPIDMDHVVTPFVVDGLWGALSKTNHVILRYRDPVYASVRELVMSYFTEYFIEDGTKTLRRYSDPLDLSVFEDDWPTADMDLWGIDEELDAITHYDIAPAKTLRALRRADPIARKSLLSAEWPPMV